MLYLGALLAFVAVVLAAFAIGEFVLERQEVFKSLRSVRAIEVLPHDLRQRQLATPFATRVLIPALRSAGGFGRRFTPASVVDRLSKEVVYAGSPPGWDAERILATKVLTTIGFVVGGYFFGAAIGFHAVRIIIVMALGGFVGYYLPEWLLRSKSGKRQNAMRRALPDALDLLSITVEAGLGFDAAVARVARQEGGPLGEEFHRVLQEMQLGKSRADALRDFGDRTSIPELKSFVLAMIQADVFGISIAKVLHVQANEMRVKRRQRAEETAQKVPVKIVFPLLTCIFPALFVVLLGPAAISIYNAFKHVKK
jgi:tight adherence protein C